MKALWKKAISRWKALSFGRKLRCVAIAVLICLVAVVVRRSVEEQKKWDREYEASYTKATQIMEKYGFTDIRITVARKTTYKHSIRYWMRIDAKNEENIDNAAIYNAMQELVTISIWNDTTWFNDVYLDGLHYIVRSDGLDCITTDGERINLYTRQPLRPTPTPSPSPTRRPYVSLPNNWEWDSADEYDEWDRDDFYDYDEAEEYWDEIEEGYWD